MLMRGPGRQILLARTLAAYPIPLRKFVLPSKVPGDRLNLLVELLPQKLAARGGRSSRRWPEEITDIDLHVHLNMHLEGRHVNGRR